MPIKRNQVYVLLAPGFRERDVVTVTETLRLAGISVLLLGLTAGPIRGDFGMAMMPDASFSTIGDGCPDAIVIPGGVRGVQQLGDDPRVHGLVRRVIAQQGHVMALEGAEVVLRGQALADRCPESAQEAARLLVAQLGQ